VRHPFFTSTRPLVFAHRGGSALAPENTLPAFDNALALGVDGLELDVHLSRDGVVVVHHDGRLERTTNLAGPIDERSADELSRADAGYFFNGGEGFPFRGRGAGVPALAQVLARYRDVRIIIELKQDSTRLARATVDAVRAAGALDRVCLGSFWRRALRLAREIEPSIATSAAREEVRWALYRSWCRWPISGAPYSGYQVPEWSGSTHVVSPRFVAAAGRAGLAVQVWTVDRADDARRLLGWGVEGLITDRPDLVGPLVKSFAPDHHGGPLTESS
jgi:glycerophosphoryl diester phosphodiesterase